MDKFLKPRLVAQYSSASDSEPSALNSATEDESEGGDEMDELDEVDDKPSAIRPPPPQPVVHKNDRDRTVKVNTGGKTGKRRTGRRGVAKGGRTASETKLSAQLFVDAFPDNMLVVDGGVLFCRACHKELARKKSTVRNHCTKSKKHKERLVRAVKKAVEDNRIAQHLRAGDVKHPQGETLSVDVRVRRHRLVRQWLKWGLSFELFDDAEFREVLEADGLVALCGTRGMRDLIVGVLKEEIARIKAEIKGQCVSALYDGSSVLHDTMAILLRFIGADNKIKQYVVKFQFLGAPIVGATLAGLIQTAFNDFDIAAADVRNFLHDRCATNGSAQRILTPLYANALDGPCIPHTINNADHKMKLLKLPKYISLTTSLIGHSDVAKNALRTIFGRRPVKTTVRFLTRLLVTCQHFKFFNNLLPAYTALLARKCSEATTTALAEFVTPGSKRNDLLMEMSLVVDFSSTPFKVSMFLEGDGYICHASYAQLLLLEDHIDHFSDVARHPNLDVMIAKVLESRGIVAGSADFDTKRENLRNNHLRMVNPCIAYYKEKMFNAGAELRHVVDLFRACRLVDPQQIVGLEHNVLALGGHLADFGAWMTPQRQAALFLELEAYVACAQLMQPGSTILDFFDQNAHLVPEWRALARDAVHAVASSCGVERVFGLTASLFSELQFNQLNDAATAAVMLRHNHRKPSPETDLDDDLPVHLDAGFARAVQFPPPLFPAPAQPPPAAVVANAPPPPAPPAPPAAPVLAAVAQVAAPAVPAGPAAPAVEAVPVEPAAAPAPQQDAEEANPPDQQPFVANFEENFAAQAMAVRGMKRRRQVGISYASNHVNIFN